MTGDQVWQTLVTVGSVGVFVFGSSWALARVLESVRASVSALKAEVQSDVAAVRADLTLLRTSIDAKLALVETQTRADVAALKAITCRLEDEVEKLKQMNKPARPRRLVS